MLPAAEDNSHKYLKKYSAAYVNYSEACEKSEKAEYIYFGKNKIFSRIEILHPDRCKKYHTDNQNNRKLHTGMLQEKYGRAFRLKKCE